MRRLKIDIESNGGLIDAAAVIPNHGQHLFGRIRPYPPGEEIGCDRRIAGIGLAERIYNVGCERRPLLQVVSVGFTVSTAVELDDDVHVLRRSDALHLLDIVQSVAIEVVVTRDPGEHGPALRCFRFWHRYSSLSSAVILRVDRVIARLRSKCHSYERRAI